MPAVAGGGLNGTPGEFWSERRRRSAQARSLPTVLASSGDTVLTVLLVVVLVAGYVVLWAIWHFFFRGR